MDGNFYSKYFTEEVNNWWFKVRRNLVFSLLRKYLKEGPGIKIFDYGCGSGYLVSKLQANNWEAHGADISLAAIEYGQKQGIANLAVSNQNSIAAPEEYFNTVLALDVLEHLENEIPVVQEIERTLKPGGITIITVPAYNFMWGVQDEISHHFRRYTASSLVNLFTKNTNLTVIKKTYFNTFLFLPIAATRLISRWFNLTKRQSDFELSKGWLNGILYRIFNSEIGLLNSVSFPFGVSILLVLRKND